MPRHIIDCTPAHPGFTDRVRFAEVDGTGTPDILWGDGINEKEINCLSGNTIDLSQVRELHFGEEPFQGAIDEVTIYPRALSEGEIYMRYSESQ